MDYIDLKEVEENCEDALTHGLYLSEIGSKIHNKDTVDTWKKMYKAYLIKHNRNDLIDN